MAFLYPQFKHPLIPQAHNPETDLSLANETREFRGYLMQLLQQKVVEFSSAYPELEENSEQLYLQVRQDLDNCPEIKQAHSRRTELQDCLWTQVSQAINCDRQRLEQEYERNLNLKGRGKLELNAEVDLPLHQLKKDIHRMPGGYLNNLGEDDFFSGAMYDHGVFLYGQGWFGSLNDELGYTLINKVIRQYYQDFQPQRILDLGCSVGHSTLPYCSEYPDAEVWGIDVGASLLRYASARAKALNYSVYFAQQNAENTDFEDQSFDLIVSHILLHEIPAVARKRLFAESYRLLKPNGLMIHLDSCLFLSPPNMTTRYFRDTEVWVNSEPYLGSSRFDDFSGYAQEAGFGEDNFQIYSVPGYYAENKGNNKPSWVVFCGRKI